MTICTFNDCIPAYILAGISLAWNAYHEYLIYLAKPKIIEQQPVN